MRHLCRALLLAALVTLVSWAGARPARAQNGDDPLRISLLTFGPGDHPFSKFGHTALLIDDRAAGTQLVYNYGTFSFDSLWLIPKFMMGKYRYWLSVQPLDRTLAAYAAENRSVVATAVRLSPKDKRELQAFVEWNARDANKYYVFDYYRDNCATRIRDILDRASAGALHESAKAPGSMTWRQHTMRLTAGSLWVYAGLYVAMGPLIDQPITRWDEMFLPEKLAQGVGEQLASAAPLTLVDATRPAPDSRPPRWTRDIAPTATAAGVALALLGLRAAGGHRRYRVALGASSAAVGLVLGLLGLLFVFLWTCTNHAVAYRNENILQCAPWALWLVPTGYRCARGRAGAALELHRAASIVWATSLSGMLLKLTPLGAQENAQVIALTLPLWSGLALASRLASGPYRRRPRGEEAAQVAH